jgi:hypothetical protein
MRTTKTVEPVEELRADIGIVFSGLKSKNRSDFLSNENYSKFEESQIPAVHDCINMNRSFYKNEH